MDKTIDYNYWKSVYEREQDIRIAYDNKLAFTITLTVAIASAYVYICNSVAPWSAKNFDLYTFIVVCSLSVTAIFIHVIMICLSYTSLKYKYKDFPVDLIKPDIKEYIENFKLDNSKAGAVELEKARQNYISYMLEETYSLCAVEYYKENIRKRKYHFLLKISSVSNTILVISLYIIIFTLKCMKGE